MLLVFSPAEPGTLCPPIKSSSPSAACFLLFRNRHATNARAPTNMAPPTPTTTPITVLFCPVVSPVLPELSLLETRPAVEVEVTVELVTTGILVVITEAIVLIPWVIEMVVVTSSFWVIAITVVWVVVRSVEDDADVVDTAAAVEVVGVWDGVVGVSGRED